MRNKKGWSVIISMVTAASMAMAASTNTFIPPPRTYVLPLMPAPALDGAIASNEWPTLSISRLIECAVPTQPITPSMFLHGRPGGVQVGSDGTNLYVAYRTSVHPQYGAICTGKRDPVKEPLRICQDDSVEIWLDPAPDSADSVAVQIIGNCHGDTVGLFFPRGTGTNALTWPVAEFRQAHGVTNGEWTAEYAIPLAALGIKDVSVPFGVRLCRSFTAPVNQCRWEAGTTLFNDPKTLCRVSFRAAAPIVRETGFFDDKGMNLGLEVRNAAAQPIEMTVSLKGSVDGKEVGRDWTETLKAGEAKPFSVMEPIPAGQTSLCEAVMTVTDKDGTPYYTRTVKWKTPVKVEWSPVALSRPACTTDVEFAWNPETKKLQYTADYSGLPTKAAIKSVRVEVADAKGTLCGGDAADATPAFRVTRELSLPKLTEGEYALTVYFDAASKSPAPDKTLRFAHVDSLEKLVADSMTVEESRAAAPHREAESILRGGDMETTTNNAPVGWKGRNGDVTVVTNQAHAGKQCLRLAHLGAVTVPFIAERPDAYWVSFWMKGTPEATFRLAFSGAWRDWMDFKATPEWKEYRFLKTYKAGETNIFLLRAEDGKGEFFVDDLAVTPILNRLSTPFSSHMVMQRGKPIPVWGKTHYPNQAVTVEFAGEKKETVSDAKGAWCVFFKARDKGGPYTLTVSDIAGALTDIVMGDVWICAGQSNMHFGLNNVNGLKTNASEIVAKAQNENLRLLFIPGHTSLETKREHDLLLDAKRSIGTWQPCTPETVLLNNVPGAWRGFSAVGYFFGQTIQEAVGVPVGLVELAVGGTWAEAWTSPMGIAGLDNVPLADVNPKDLKADSPSANWNAMVAPMLPMPVKGILWYQGESNSSQAPWYDRVLSNLIRDWRLHFRQGDLPFYFVQICSWDGYQPFEIAWAHLRESQSKVAQSDLTNVAMAVSYDLEDENNPWEIHPRNKKDVADRLSRIALARDYGKKDVVYASPTYREMKREGNTIRLFFDHAEGGLMARGDNLNGFRIIDDQGRFHDATAVVDGETVVASAPGVENPAHVRYAFVQYTFPKPNLYNKAGLPASPFRTDGQ